MIEQKIGRMASSLLHVYLLFFSCQCVHIDVLLHVEELEAEVIPIEEEKDVNRRGLYNTPKLDHQTPFNENKFLFQRGSLD